MRREHIGQRRETPPILGQIPDPYGAYAPVQEALKLLQSGQGSSVSVHGCSTLSTEGPLEECVDTAESGGVAILIER